MGTGDATLPRRRHREIFLVPTLRLGTGDATLPRRRQGERTAITVHNETLVMARDRYRIYPGSEPYFLTCTIVGWLPVFTRQETVQIVLDSWKFLQSKQRLTLFGYVILENHLHFIATAPDLAKEVGDFKSFTGHEIIGVLKSRGVDTLLHQLEFLKETHKRDRRYQLWQEGSHPKALQ